MPQTRIIDIHHAPGQAHASFSPKTLSAAAGDLIHWRNHTSSPHWPTLKTAPVVKDTWMDAEIPAKLPTQPAPVSPQALSFSGGSAEDPPQVVEYVCALHPEETGTIVVE